MENSAAARDRLWDEQQLANRVREDLEHRAWLKSFALVLALVVLTLTVVKVLASWGTAGTVRL